MDLNLENKLLKGFKVRDLFILESGIVASFSKMLKGDQKIDCVGATSRNNGSVGFVDSRYRNLAVDGNCIVFIRTGEGSVGDAIYKGNIFIPSKNVSVGRSEKLNRYTANFLVNIINKQAHKYNYGYVRSDDRLENEILLLPTDSHGNPDYAFMEAYMKDLEQKMLSKYKKFIGKRLSDLDIQMGGEISLASKGWREFYLQDIFEKMQRGKRLKKADHKLGKTPYVSSTATSNGIDGFIGNEKGVRIFKNCLTIANSGSVGATFYHSYKFVASDHVTKLENSNLNEHTYKFISVLMNRMGTKYSFNREINDSRIKKERIMLPVNQSDQPDYEFMENYMKKLEYQKVQQYLDKKYR